MNGTSNLSEEAAMNAAAPASEEAAMKGYVHGEVETMDVPLRPEEKRRLPFQDGLYLAPLTTVGNLVSGVLVTIKLALKIFVAQPFRRLCVDYGATITCSEMALAQPLVTGQRDEWALVRRHETEKTFGVQIAGGYANVMVPTAEMIAKEIGGGVDFVDVNLVSISCFLRTLAED